MLEAIIKPHRPYLRANAGLQKLFVMLKLLPSAEAGRIRPPVQVAIVVDTSGSMREPAPGTTPEIVPITPVTVDGQTYNGTYKGTSKLDLVTQATRGLIESSELEADDRISLIQFDDNSRVLDSGTVGAERSRLLDAVQHLHDFSGGTQMARGLQNALDQLSGPDNAVRTVLLLTDGRTIDEEDCHRVAESLAVRPARIIAIGVGDEYNEDLLADLCNVTHGRPHDSRDLTTLPQVFQAELGSATRQVIGDVEVAIKLVRDVRLVSASRVYPELAELDPSQSPLKVGSLEAGDYTVFILELDVPQRPPIRARLAQIGVTYRLQTQDYRDELAPVDVAIEFTDDEALAAAVDPEVMGYVQQRNVDNLVRQATQQAEANPAQAAKTLQVARSMTQRIGNRRMTVALGRAEDELRGSGTISLGTRKTIKLGARTRTMKVGSPDEMPQNVPSQEEIRRLTGA